jgi:pilus assembly protein CpaE
VSTTTRILVVGPDPALRKELDAALASLSDLRPAVHAAADLRQGVEAVRNRHPHLVVVEMSCQTRALEVFAGEVAALAPDSTVVAAFSPAVFGPDVSESTLLIAALRAGVRDFLRRPLSSADLEQLLARILSKTAATPANLGSVTCFLSNKGGVGKSTLAVNAAVELAQRWPERVLLIDASLQLGVCASLLDLRPATTLTDACRERDRLDSTMVRDLATPHETGLHLLAAPPDAIEASAIDDDLMARVLNLARRTYDVVIVDSFPLLDRVMMAVLDVSDREYVVLEGTVPTVLGAARFLDLLGSLGYPPQRQSVILSRHTGGLGNLSPADVAARLRRAVDHVVPFENGALVAANVGRPYVLTASRWFSRFRPAIRRLADEIAAVRPNSGPPRQPVDPPRLTTSEKP